MLRLLFSIACWLYLAGQASAQVLGGGLIHGGIVILTPVTVANLPTNREDGYLAFVSDGLTSGNCETGLGLYRTVCAWNATSSHWEPVVPISGAAATLAALTAITRADAVDSTTAMKIGNGTIHWLLYCDSSNACVIQTDQASDWVVITTTGKNFAVRDPTGVTDYFNIEADGDLTRLLAGTQTSGDIAEFNGTKWVRKPASRVALVKAADQAIADNTETSVLFDTENLDTDTMHSLVSNTSRITFTTAGTYLVGGVVNWEAGTPASSSLCLKLNGTTYLECAPTSVTRLYAFAAADYVELRIFQNSGGALDIDGDGVGTPNFWAARQ